MNRSCLDSRAAPVKRRAASAGPASLAQHEEREPLLDVAAVAAWLAVSPRTVWSITAPRGALRCVRVGRAVRYRPSDVRAYLAKGGSR